MSPGIQKNHCDTEIATLTLPAHVEHCITVQSSDALEMNRCLKRAVEECRAVRVNQFVFAGTQHYDEFKKDTDCPVVWLQGDACTEGRYYSMQAVALSGVKLKPISFKGRHMGFVYEDDSAVYCRLCGVIPQDLSASRMDQTRSAFETVNAILQQTGFEFTDTVRTWIYLDQLLEWYDDFNTVRTQYFTDAVVFDSMVPASTGIGAKNQYGSAIMIDAYAVKPKTGSLKIHDVVSPMQNPALDYKSSFSRVVEMEYPTHKILIVSGTASIDESGATVYQDDSEKQIRHTLQVVQAILESRGMGWGDLFRGIAYFKDIADLDIYKRVAAELGIKSFPLAISHADICRHDLLFEIEVDAVKLV